MSSFAGSVEARQPTKRGRCGGGWQRFMTHFFEKYLSLYLDNDNVVGWTNDIVGTRNGATICIATGPTRYDNNSASGVVNPPLM